MQAYQRAASKQTTAMRQDLQGAEKRQRMHEQEVKVHAEAAEAATRDVKADTDAVHKLLSGLGSRFTAAEDSVQSLKLNSEEAVSRAGKAWDELVPVWEASGKTLAELNDRSRRVNPILERVDGQTRTSKADLERIRETITDIVTSTSDVLDKMAVLDTRNSTAELTNTVNKLHENTLHMVKLFVDARQVIGEISEEVRGDSKALSTLDSRVQASMKDLHCKQEELVVQLERQDHQRTLETERDAAKASIDLLNADLYRLKREAKSKDDQLAKMRKDDSDVRARFAALEQDLRSKDEQLRTLSHEHARTTASSEKRGLEESETANAKRRRVSSPSDLPVTPEWATQVENLVSLLYAIKARVEPGPRLRADGLMRETLWCLVQPETTGSIQDFLAKEEPQDKWLCWISVLDGGYGRNCACNVGENCIQVKKEGPIHVFRAGNVKK